ncbi:MAG: GIY-YIG nuclease family protein [Candidatus Tectomicrobia bacterium]|uniref:GIY-YIG nuclease family protein n=1 Tax=Tectimicrobiota bacterium TaxID=2528274 RepID=A0A932GMI4_UNCTE|nr:GIY-YIG nuclease family protein [Candidatus Tectomicrobia bacterium]
MNEDFRRHIETLEPAYQRLQTMSPVTVRSLPEDVPQAGVYLFSNERTAWYVGRSNRMRQRLQEHCRRSSGHNTAPFAFRIARELTGKAEATYSQEGSRIALEKDPNFQEVFQREKERIADMELRFVQEADPVRQALLEIYVAMASRARYNDFDTH